MSTQVQRIPSDLGAQRLDDRTKNVVMNKRIRTSVEESRSFRRSVIGLPLIGLLAPKGNVLWNFGSLSDLAS